MIDGGAQFAYDSIPDKLARESAVLAAGVTKGLFAAAENIYENPGQTAIQVATGVAISALVTKADFLKLPALAMAVYGGGESLFKARDFVASVSPAVANVWRNPSVSKSTTDHLESQISDGTASAAITGASFFLANKGFAALESSAPNNSLGRLLFNKEPVSFRFPRHAVHLSESGRPELELLPFKPRELARLVNRETRDITYNAYSPGPFKDAAEARAIGKRPFVAKSQVYTIGGTKTEVVIPDWLDKRFDQVRGLEREVSFPRSILNIGKLDSLKTQLAQHPLSQFAKPEDVLTQLSVLPVTRYTPLVTVSPYSLDIFAKNILPKGASTSESAAKMGETIGMAVKINFSKRGKEELINSILALP